MTDYSSQIDLTRDEPPTQAQLDHASKDNRCESCGRKTSSHSPREWLCECGHSWPRKVVVRVGRRLTVIGTE